MPRVFYPAFRGIIIWGIERRKIFRENKDRDNLVEAVRELGISGTHLAKRLGMSQSGVVYAVNKGEKAAKEKNYQLVV
ncbi:MAG: hypothetical protein KAV87_11110 [Desulfobacteraceae bacterium]|nr:hypothetical protein [Desulfobacteraceae bacterium]